LQFAYLWQRYATSVGILLMR